MFKRWRLILVSILVVMILVPVTAFTLGSIRAASPGQSFTFLQAGFTQQIFGVSSSFLGGVAFAPNGDPWVDECAFAGSNLHRFDAQTTTVVNSTTLHPESIVASAAGCGMTNHPDGTLYSNTSNGVANLDANTGTLIRTLGPPGNVLGITVDPQTNHLVYVGADCRFTATCSIIDLDPVSGTSRNFAVLSATDAQFVDGIYFDSTGNFLFMSNRSPQFRLTVLNRSGAIVQHVPMTSEPDGIAFHGGTTQFVVTNNTDGTMTRFDFPNNDFTQTPTQSVFASGGFRGDLSQVGSDNCLYITQDGTRYDDGTVTSQDSLVRLCPNFVPPPGVTPKWGVDSYNHITQSFYNQITTTFGAPSFFGRYIGGDPATSGFPNDMDTNEAPVAHNNNLAILPIYFNFGTTKVIGYATGQSYAKAAIKDAQQRLHIPQGVAIFVDIEASGKEPVTPDAAFIQGWYDTFNTTFLYGDGNKYTYQAGYYKAGYYASTLPKGNFATPFCAAVSQEPAIATNSFLWTPNISHTPISPSDTKANAPMYNPVALSCSNQQIPTPAAWQYVLHGESSLPNVDLDEALASLPLWHP